MKKVFLAAIAALSMMACSNASNVTDTSYNAWLDMSCIVDYTYNPQTHEWLIRYDSDQTFCEQGDAIIVDNCNFLDEYENGISQEEIDSCYAIRVTKDADDNVIYLEIININ